MKMRNRGVIVQVGSALACRSLLLLRLAARVQAVLMLLFGVATSEAHVLAAVVAVFIRVIRMCAYVEADGEQHDERCQEGAGHANDFVHG
jgi:hypothetical protein